MVECIQLASAFSNNQMQLFNIACTDQTNRRDDSQVFCSGTLTASSVGTGFSNF